MSNLGVSPSLRKAFGWAFGVTLAVLTVIALLDYLSLVADVEDGKAEISDLSAEVETLKAQQTALVSEAEAWQEWIRLILAWVVSVQDVLPGQYNAPLPFDFEDLPCEPAFREVGPKLIGSLDNWIEGHETVGRGEPVRVLICE